MSIWLLQMTKSASPRQGITVKSRSVRHYLSFFMAIFFHFSTSRNARFSLCHVVTGDRPSGCRICGTSCLSCFPTPLSSSACPCSMLTSPGRNLSGASHLHSALLMELVYLSSVSSQKSPHSAFNDGFQQNMVILSDKFYYDFSNRDPLE